MLRPSQRLVPHTPRRVPDAPAGAVVSEKRGNHHKQKGDLVSVFFFFFFSLSFSLSPSLSLFLSRSLSFSLALSRSLSLSLSRSLSVYEGFENYVDVSFSNGLS